MTSDELFMIVIFGGPILFFFVFITGLINQAKREDRERQNRNK